MTDPYHALVNVSASQAGAAAKGLKRVVPGDLASSFLDIKLTLPMPSDATYGLRMPNTGMQVSAAQLAEVQSWITAGALNN